jgi:Ni/Co efflux regulator RcnB
VKLTLVLVAVLATALAQPALAQGRGNGPPDRVGSPGKGHGNDNAPGQGQGQGQGQGHGQGRGNSQAAVPPGNVVIADRDRTTVYNYYRGQYAAGNCPPGLAKKNNGCLPPGQANKLWAIGQPLPGSVMFYPLPGALLGQLTPAPAGYQYVQVASDILLMAIGTRMIVGALADLSAM